MNPLQLSSGKTARAICESTEADPLGAASRWTASQETPRKRKTAIAARMPSVCAAFFACGFLNAPTPFAIASIPVSALAPEENALRIRKTVSASVPGGIGSGVDACGHPEIAHSADPRQDHRPHQEDEPVGGNREDLPRLPRPAQVEQRDQDDEPDRDLDRRPLKSLRRRGDREHPGGDRDRDRQHVVDQQRRGRQHPGEVPEVLLRDDERPAARRVGMDDLRVGGGDDDEERRHRDRDREDLRPRGERRRRSGRRAPTRSRRRPTRARRRRRSAARGASRGASRSARAAGSAGRPGGGGAGSRGVGGVGRTATARRAGRGCGRGVPRARLPTEGKR